MKKRPICKKFAFLCLIALMMVSILVIRAQATYIDPSWAPDWFKTCNGAKQWAEWTFDYSTPPDTSALQPENTDKNYSITNYESPYINLTGAMAWIPGPEFQRSGLIGINPAAQHTTIDFHAFMDNQKASLVKQVWFQFDMIVPLEEWSDIEDGTNMGGSIVWDSGSNPLNPTLGEPQAFGWRSVTSYFEIDPQPDWDRVDFVFTVPDQQYLFIDNVKMATQCVPEPSTLLLLFSGLIGIVGFEKKRLLGRCKNV